MIDMCDFVDCSVIVLSYYPEKAKLLATLRSVLLQSRLPAEIIIADDASDDFPMDDVVYLMDEFGYDHYQIVRQKKNKGTVCNLLDAVQTAKCKWVKPISPGDYFYSEDSLFEMYSFVEKHDTKIAFGDMVYYHLDSTLTTFLKQDPQFNELYDPSSFQFKKALKYQLIFSDHVSGASVFVDRQLLLEGLKHIKGIVIYAEDVLVQWFLCIGENVLHYPEYFVWYEYGSGISTNGNQAFSKRILNDFVSFYDWLKKHYPNQAYVKRCAFMWHKFQPWNPSFLFFVLNPDRFIFAIKNRLAKKRVKKAKPDDTYLYQIVRF